MLAVIAAPSGLEQYKLSSVDKAAETATIAAGVAPVLSGVDEIGLKTLERAT